MVTTMPPHEAREPMSYPLVVELRATYETVRWYDECDECGAEVTANTDGRAVLEQFGRYGGFHGGGGLICPVHGLRNSAEVTTTEYPEVAGGWCSVSNPYGNRGTDTSGDHETGPGSPWYDDREAFTVRVSPVEAAEIVAEFPGAVWDLHDDGDGSTDMRTGATTTVTLHVEDQHAAYVFELARNLGMVAA